MWTKCERYLVDLIKGRRKGFTAWLVKAFLFPFSGCFRLGVGIRNWAFDHGWIRQYYAPIPVLSIGNIVAGGTGKTPATLLLAQQFESEFNVAILSRGYRSKAEKMPTPVMLCEGYGPLHPASFCGDEPFLLASRLPKAIVVVGQDRRRGSMMAVTAGADLILLDDGMQYRYLARDFEVIVMDARDPFGSERFLPSGLLRDEVSTISRADLIILNHAFKGEPLSSLMEKFRRHTHAPVVSTELFMANLWDLQGKKISTIQGKRVGVFCAIGRPEYFRQTVQELGAVIISEQFLSDHDTFDQERLSSFSKECLEKKVDLLVCTEKDKVKIAAETKVALPIVWMEMKLRIVAGQTEWDAFIAKVKATVKS